MATAPLDDVSALKLIDLLDQATDRNQPLTVEVRMAAALRLAFYAFSPGVAFDRLAYIKARDTWRRANNLRLEHATAPWLRFLAELGLPSDGAPYEPVRPSQL